MADSALVVFALLLVGFLATRFARMVRLPHSVFLVIIGLVFGWVLKETGMRPPESITGSFSDLILFVLLPPLVFESAYSLHLSDLKKNLSPIFLMAVGGLLLSTFIVGFGVHWLLGLALFPSLVFGALISATDPVAVVALFREVGAPRRLTVLVEGESLFNDGTAIVLYRVLVAAAVAPFYDGGIWLSGLSKFAVVALGGVAIGLGVALITSACLRLTSKSDSAQIGITVSAAYLSFLIAEHSFHVSGIFATLVVGLFLGNRARLELNRDALHGMHSVWGFLALSANSVVFLAVGLLIRSDALLEALPAIPLTIAIVYGARAIAVMSAVAPINFFKLAKPISFPYQIVMMWGGLRGGLAIGLALMLPENFAQKPLILALTTSVVLSTLLLNALTIRHVMHFLKIDRLDHLHEGFYYKTLDIVRKNLFLPLLDAVQCGILSKPLVQKYSSRILQPLKKCPDRETEKKFQCHHLLLEEQNYYDSSLEEGLLSKQAYRSLSRSVQERVDLIHHGSLQELKDFLFDHFHKKEGRVSLWLGGYFVEWHHHRRLGVLAIELETLLHLDLAVRQAALEIEDEDIESMADAWAERAKAHLLKFYAIYPSLALGIQSRFIIDTAEAGAKHHLDHLYQKEIISGGVYQRADKVIGAVYEEWLEENRKMLNANVDDLLSHLTLFQELSSEEMKKLASVSKAKYFEAGETVLKAGQHLDSFYLVTSGVLEASGHFLTHERIKPKLLAGDFFGEVALLPNNKNGESAYFLDVDGDVHIQSEKDGVIKALIDSEVLEIHQKEFLEVLADHPEVAKKITQGITQYNSADGDSTDDPLAPWAA